MEEVWLMKRRVIEQQHQARMIGEQHLAKMIEEQSMALEPLVRELAHQCPPSRVLQIDSCCSSVEETSWSASRWQYEEQENES
jgi:hypothetical protein